MAKLGGTADPTIVKMAYAAALGNVPGDHSDHYKTMVDTHKELLKGIDEQFKAYQVSKAIDEVAFQTAMSVFDNPLAAQAIDSDYDMMYAEVEAQRQLYEDNKGFKDDDKGLADWNRKNNQIVQRYQGNQQDLVDIKAGVDAKLYDTSTMPKADLNFVTNIANYQGNKNGKSGIYNAKATEYMKANPDATAEQVWNSLGIKDEGVVVKYHDPATGEYTYMSKVTNDDGDTEIVSAKSGELKDKFGQGKKADGALADAEEVYLSVSKQASQTTDSWDKFSNSARNRLETSIDKSMEDNPNTLRYLMHKKVGGQSQTFADALRSGKDGIGLKESIIAGLEGVNSDGDGKLERSDFASGEEGTKNYNKVVNSILNGKLDETNPGATKSMYLDFMDKEFKTEHDLRKKVKEPTKTPTDPTDENPFGTSTKRDIQVGPSRSQYGGTKAKFTPQQAQRKRNQIVNGETFYFNVDEDGKIVEKRFDYIGGTWYQSDKDGDPANEETRVEIGSANDLVFQVIKSDHSGFQNLETVVDEKVDDSGNVIETQTQSLTVNQQIHREVFDTMNVNKDDSVSDSLNAYFVDHMDITGLNERSKLMFMPYTGKLMSPEWALKEGAIGGSVGGTRSGVLGIGSSGDAIGTNDIMLYNPRTGEVIKNADGTRKRFKIGSDMADLDENSRLSADLTEMLEILKQHGIKPPDKYSAKTEEDAQVDAMYNEYVN